MQQMSHQSRGGLSLGPLPARFFFCLPSYPPCQTSSFPVPTGCGLSAPYSRSVYSSIRAAGGAAGLGWRAAPGVGSVSLPSPGHLAEFPMPPPSSLGREAGCALGRGDKEHGRRDRSKGPVWKLRSSPRSNQSILKGINPEYLLEGLMLKLKTPILWPLDSNN